MAHLLCCAALLVFSILQRPGETTFDTKFNLTADPAGFLGRALHLWNPQTNFGELQNQAYGYLFPQGAWFAGADLIGLPDWWAQRLWSALVLLAAYEGARRLARALLGEDRVVAVLTGLAYATAPRLLGLSGVLSGEVLPTAVLPWIVLPLVLGLRGRISPRRAGLLSGVALLFAGGVNAVENLAVLPLAALLVLSGLRSAGGRRLAGWWVLATTLAAAWWMAPLLVMGRYSPRFLDYIESATTTTGPLGWSNSVRGADHWLAYLFVGGRPWWPGANMLVTTPALVLAAAVVVAVGLLGLVSRSMPLRLPLVGSLLLGLLCLTIAHTGPLDAVVSQQVRDLLDGALAPFRNVHKVDPLIRLPLALGLGHAVLRLRESEFVIPRRALSRLGDRLPGGRLSWVRPTATVAVAALLVVSSWPLLTGNLRTEGWSRVPGAWQQAADHLAATSEGTTLVVPGAGFGLQQWGWTVDEPMQALARTPWVSRGQAPLVPGPTIRLLESIEQALADGVGSPGLADLLASAGIDRVLLRRDLAPAAVDGPSPERVEQALTGSRGLVHESSFGRSGLGEQPMIDIYEVLRPTARFTAPTTSSVLRLAGSPDDLATARESGVLAPGRTTVVGGDRDPDPDVVGDGFRRQERQFGRVHDALSQMMTRTESYRQQRPAHDYAGVPGAHRATIDLGEVTDVVASSSTGYADSFGAIRSDQGPLAAFDGSTVTAWHSAPFERPEGQWIEVRFAHPTLVRSVTVDAAVSGLTSVPVRRIAIEAGGDRRVSGVDPLTGRAGVDLPGRPVRSLRLEVTAVAGHPATGVVAIGEVSIGDRPIRPTLVVPSAAAGAETSFVLRAGTPRRACVHTAVAPVCDSASARLGDEAAGLRRELSVSSSGRWTLSGTAVARSTPATAMLLQPIGARQPALTASSVYAADPQVAGVFALDGDRRTVWLAGQGDAAPVLRLALPRARTLTRLRVYPAEVASTMPTQAVVRTEEGSRVVGLGSKGLGFFEPLRGQVFDIEFRAAPGADLDRRPIGIAELAVEPGVLVSPVVGDRRTGARCGLGPEVEIDGTPYPTSVSGTIGAVVEGQPLSWEVCEGPVGMDAGSHRLVVTSTEQFAVRTAALRSTEEPAPAERRAVQLERWGVVGGRLRVAAGEQALLRIPANRNAGWEARADGRRLEATTVDGWQQAFVLPAGAEASVEVVYAPDRAYRGALAGGVGAAALLLLMAMTELLGFRRRSGDPAGAESRSVWTVGPFVAVPVAGLAWVLAGPAVLAGLLTGWLLARRAKWRWIAAAMVFSVVAGGTAAALSAGLGAGRPGLLADLCSAAAIGLLLATVAVPRPSGDRVAGAGTLGSLPRVSETRREAPDD